MDNWLQIILALIAGLVGGGGVAWYLAGSQKQINEAEAVLRRAEARKKEAEEDELAAKSWVLLVQTMSGQIAAQKVEIDALKCEVGELRQYINEHGLPEPPRKR